MSVHLNIFCEDHAFTCQVFFCLKSMFEKKHLECVTSEAIIATLGSQALAVCFDFRSDSIFQFVLGRSKIKSICVRFQLLELSYNRKNSLTMEYSCNNRSCAYSRRKELPKNDWFFDLNLCFGEFNLL